MDSAPIPGFESPWQRVLWLVTGRNRFPAEPLPLAPGALIRNLLHSKVLLFLFELGPVALPAVIAGFLRLFMRDRLAALVLALVGGLSLLFTAAVASGPMIHIFLLPCTLACVILIAADLESLLGDQAKLSRGRAGLVALLVFLALALPPQLIRIRADHHPIGRWKLHVEEEDPSFQPVTVPSLRGFTAPREYGTRALAAIPRGSLVLADWPEYENLQYFRVIEGRRLDLTLEPMSRETLRERMRAWQRAHAVERHPFVFLSRPAAALAAGAALDSTQLGAGRWLWVRRVPIGPAQ